MPPALCQGGVRRLLQELGVRWGRGDRYFFFLDVVEHEGQGQPGPG